MLWICDACTTAYSVGAPACPHCGETDYTEQGAEHDGESAPDTTEPTDDDV